MESVQVNNNLGIHVSLHAMVAGTDDLLPDLSVAHLCAQGPPLLRPKRLLALVRIQLDDGIQDGQIQAPHLDPRRP